LYLEPTFDGFRNYLRPGHVQPTEQLLLEKANLLTLTAPEMAVLVAGLRVIGANYQGSAHGVFTDNVGALTSDFFVNVLSMDYVWTPTDKSEEIFEGHSRATGNVVFTGTRNDLIFGSNSQLRAIAEVYAQHDNREKFARDFVKAWNKVMNLDRFDLK
jgi:catalase-peroxidase